MLFNVPPLAFHVTDLKLELVPSYSHNKPLIIPKLHGKFNISINMESQHVNNSMEGYTTLDISTKASTGQLYHTSSIVNVTHGSNFGKSYSEMKKIITKAHDKKTDNYLPNSLASRKF